MPLSHSRIQSFKKCRFAFKRQYIDKVKSNEKSDPLRVGSCVHEILEGIEKHCLETTMLNQFNASRLAGNFTITPQMGAFIRTKYGEVSRGNLIKAMFNHPMIMSRMTNVIDFYKALDEAGAHEKVTTISFVSELCQKLLNSKMAEHVIETENLRNDVTNMVERFVASGGFERFPGEIIYLESEMAFDPDWNPVEWLDPRVSFRGKADKIVFNFVEKFISVFDYKTSRKAMTRKEAERDYQLKLYLAFMRKEYKTDFGAIRVVWDYVRLNKKIELSFANEEIDREAADAENWVLDNRQQINEAIKNNDFPCSINKYCDDCPLRLSECTIFGGKASTDIEKPSEFVIKTEDDAKDVYAFIQAVKYKAEILTAKLKKFVDNSASPINIGDGMTLGYNEKQEREFDALKTHSLLLNKGIDPKIIYDFTTITRSDFEKLLLRAKVRLTEEELDKISAKKDSRKFGIVVPGD